MKGIYTKLLILLILNISITFAAKQLITKRVLWAVDSGSFQNKKSLSGYVYQKDKEFQGDTINVDYSTDSNYNGAVIKYTYDPEIYMTERHAYKSFSYLVPLNKSGTFTLILKFAEMYFKDGGNRVFNIKFGDERVVTGLDVAGQVGRFAAYDEYIEFQFRDGGVYFKDTLCKKAIKDGKLVVTFEKTEKDNPFVHGIMLYDGNLKDTDYHDRETIKEEWERNYKQEQRKQELEKVKKQDTRTKQKEKIKPRNDYSNDIEDDFELEYNESEKKVVVERFSIKKFLTSYFGILILGAGLAFGLYLFKIIIVDPMDYNKIGCTQTAQPESVDAPAGSEVKQDNSPQKETKENKKDGDSKQQKE